MDMIDHAIREWKRSLQKHGGLEPGVIAELEDHLRIRVTELTEKGMTPRAAVETAAGELGDPAGISLDFEKTNRKPGARLMDRLFQVLPSLTGNYLKTAMRLLKRNPLYTIINVVGLSVSLAVCIMILLFVHFHLSFDSFHNDADRIYLVLGERTTERSHQIFPSNLTPMGQAIRDRFPQVEATARTCRYWSATIQKDGIAIPEERVRYTEPDLFTIFDYRFIEGTRKHPFNGPDSVVISRSLADIYLGPGPALGKQINMSEQLFTVSAVVEDLPSNSMLPDAIFVPWERTLESEYLRGWEFGVLATITYVKLKPETDPFAFGNLIRDLPHEYMADQLTDAGMRMGNVLQPLIDTNLHWYNGDRLEPTKHLVYVWIFSAAGLLILLIACLNYINLSTARALRRASEIGMRKVSGASRGQLILQFLGESIITVLIAVIFSLLIIEISLPLFNRLADTSFTLHSLLTPAMISGMIVLVLLVGILGGLYPALVLSSFRPNAVLRGSYGSSRRGSTLRTVLVVVQFMASIFLIIGTTTVYQQLHHMRSMPLGFDVDNKIVLRLRSWESLPGDRVEPVRSAFLSIPEVKSVTTGSGVPGISVNRLWMYPAESDPDNGLAVRCLRCDRYFIDTFDIPLLASVSDLENRNWESLRGNFLINETAMRTFGWKNPEDAVNQTLLIGSDRTPTKIVGVVRDFHWYGLQQELEPMVIRLVHMARYITLELEPGKSTTALPEIRRTYETWFPGDLFDYLRVDANFQQQYQFEEKIGNVFTLFSGIGMLIACLGLFGMAAFSAAQRTKEIGIRKVMGATVFQISSRMTWEFIRWVLLAGVLVWPVTYWAANWWLSGFAYRVDQQWWVYVTATLSAVVIALLTVSGQAIRNAQTNPVESLKYE